MLVLAGIIVKWPKVLAIPVGVMLGWVARTERLIDSTTRYVYVGEVSASRPASDFTPRLMPFHAGASEPLEAPFILWYARPR